MLLHKSDMILIDLIAKGDDAALTSLYNANYKMVLRYITANSGTQQDAEEQLQDALVILWEKIRFGSFEVNAKLSTYLYAVVKNRWHKELARKKRYVDLNSKVEPADSTPLMIDILQENDLVDLVKKCMEELPEICRSILTLYYYENKSMKEISVTVGLANEKSAKTKKYQCKKELEFLLRSCLNE